MSEMSLRQMGKILGVSHVFLSQIKNGKRPMPDTLRERVEALGAYHLLTTETPNTAFSDTNQRVAPGLGPGGRQFESARPDYTQPWA